MEVLNPTLRSTPNLFLTNSISSPQIRITPWRKTTTLRLNISTSRFSRSRHLSATSFRITAHFGRHSNRRNYLRKKLTEQQQQQVRQIPLIPNPISDSEVPIQTTNEYSDNDSAIGGDLVRSDPLNESKSKIVGESVMWNKLEGWVDQYKKDSEFWGLGFGPIFTVFQDSDRNVNRVVVNEDEILRRSGIQPSSYSQGEFEDLIEVNSKISHAKFLARQVESGNYELPKNSPVAKFVVSGEKLSFVSAIRGIALQPGLVPRLSRAGIILLCGFIVFGAWKRVAATEKDKPDYTSLEKEMLRRKMKARAAKESLVKGSVEVIQDSSEPEMVSSKRPQLDKSELMDSILKSKTSSEKSYSQKSARTQAIDNEDFDKRIQEIRSMARHAREIERRDHSSSNSDGEDDQTENEMSDNKSTINQYDEEVPNQLPKTSSLTGATMPIIISNSKSDDIEFGNGIALAETSDTQTFNVPNIEVPDIKESIARDVEGRGTEVNQSSNTLNTQSSISNSNSSRTKPRVIRSVQEARAFLYQKRHKQEPNQDSQVKVMQKDDTVSYLPSIEQKSSVTSHRLDKDCEASNPSDACEDPAPKRNKSFPTTVIDPEASEEKSKVIDFQIHKTLDHAAYDSYTSVGPSASDFPDEKDAPSDTNQELDQDDEVSQASVISEHSDSTSNVFPCEYHPVETQPFVQTESRSPEHFEEDYELVDHQMPGTSSRDHESNDRGVKAAQSLHKENWLEKNFDTLEPVVKRIASGFRDNYMVAKEKVKEDLNLNPEMIQPQPDEDGGELEWMKDDRLREIVFKVRENELTGRDPFHLMDEDDKHAFFTGLEKKVERENEKLLNLHEWVHSNIENLDYGADGISLYDTPEKIIPRWKNGPPFDKNSELFNDIIQQRTAHFAGNFSRKEDKEVSLQKSEESVSYEDDPATLAAYHQDTGIQEGSPRNPKTVIEGSDGSVRAGKKSGKEYWQHTKKWSRGFLESYNAESDPEIKSVMKDIGKDLNRWITEKEIQEAADLMDKVPEKGRKFIEGKLNKVKREMELFGPQAVVSKYQEYAEDKEEDCLWWLDLPFVLCIELYTSEDGEQKIGFYSLEMAEDLNLEPKQYHVIAFEDPGDCKNFCYIIQAHMEMLGNGNAFVIARPPKDAFREAKANGFSVTVIRKGEIQLNVDQKLEEVEEQITEIGSKIYHDKIMRQRSVDISSLMKGVFGTSKPNKRRRSKRKPKKKPTKS